MSSIDIFSSIPRLPIAPLMTPIHRCVRVEQAVKGMPELYVKHDEFIGPLVWGNKLRKLEYVFAKAREEGADNLIPCGGIQSNHARTTAQAALRFGFRVILVLNGTRPARPTGNLLIDYKIGAEIHFVESREERAERMNTLAAREEENGHKVLIIPLGASDDTGALGFVKAIEELRFQEQESGVIFDHIIHATSSGGTQAGMLVGKKIFGLHAAITGISADDPAGSIEESIQRIAAPMMDRLKIEPESLRADVHVDDAHFGQGYGIPSEASLEAEQLFARNEGILLDHFYTAKAAAALINYARAGRFESGQKILFWHTGGTIALFQ